MRSPHHMKRDLDAGLCSALRSFNTTYNGEKDVPPYVGYMFEISAKSDVKILTFELDIRFDLNPTDLSIEVYTYDGAYDIVIDKPEAWDQIAGTYLIPTSPERGSALIPASEFSPVQIAEGEKRSFYVTMKYPYLDHTVYGLQQTGDIHIAGDDLQLLVGSGFHGYKFPGAVDPILNPQFAGVVHYQKSFACDDTNASTTMVDFQFLFEVSVLNEALVLKVKTAIDVAISTLLASKGKLKSFVSEFGLRKSLPTESYLVSHTSICPDDWVECPSSYLNVRVNFHHRDSLDSGLLRYEMYKLTSPIIDATLAAPASGVKTLYVGYVSTEAKYTLWLQDVPSSTMDEIQLMYFEETTELFLQNSPDGTLVFRWQVDKQSVSGSKRELRRLLDGDTGRTLELEGIVKGAYFAGRTSNDFSITVGKMFESKETTYLSLLKNGDVRPGFIRNSISYFQNISSVSSLIDFPAQVAASGPKKTTVAAGVFGSLGGLLLLVGFCLFFRHRRNEKIRSIELEEYRKEMRDRRRATRFEKSACKESFCASDLLTPDGKQHALSSSESMNLSANEVPGRPVHLSTEKRSSCRSSSIGDSSKSSLRNFDTSTGMCVERDTGMDGQILRTRSKSEMNAEALHASRQAVVPLLSRDELPRDGMIPLDGITKLRTPHRQLLSAVSSPNLGRESYTMESTDDSAGLRASFPLSPRSPTSRTQAVSSEQRYSPSSRIAAVERHRRPSIASTPPYIVTRHLVTAASSPCLGAMENSASDTRGRMASRASLPTRPSQENSQRPFVVCSTGTMSPKSTKLRLLATRISLGQGTNGSPKSTAGNKVACSPISPGDNIRVARPLRSSFPMSLPLDTGQTPSKTQSPLASQDVRMTTVAINSNSRILTASVEKTSPRNTSSRNSQMIGVDGAPSPKVRRLVTSTSSLSLETGTRGTGRSIGSLRASFPMSLPLDTGQTPSKTQSPLASQAIRMTASVENTSPRNTGSRNSQMIGVDGAPSPKVKRLVTSTSSKSLETGTRRPGRSIGSQNPISPTDRLRISRPHLATFPVSPPLDTCKLSPHEASPRLVRASVTPGINSGSGRDAASKQSSPLRSGDMSPCAPARRMVTAASSPCLGSTQKFNHANQRSPISQTNQLPFRASLPTSLPLVSGPASSLPKSGRSVNITGFPTVGNGKSLGRSQTANESSLPSLPFLTNSQSDETQQ